MVELMGLLLRFVIFCRFELFELTVRSFRTDTSDRIFGQALRAFRLSNAECWFEFQTNLSDLIFGLIGLCVRDVQHDGPDQLFGLTVRTCQTARSDCPS
jgi:hypothetical protein